MGTGMAAKQMPRGIRMKFLEAWGWPRSLGIKCKLIGANIENNNTKSKMNEAKPFQVVQAS